MRFLNPALSERDILINGVMGLCGEAGEVIDLVKKHLAQGHPLDRTALAGELGDVAWYLAETAHVLGFTLEESAEMLGQRISCRAIWISCRPATRRASQRSILFIVPMANSRSCV